MSKSTHLWNRKGYYYFRIIVPVKLINRFGCKELSCSLRTKNEFQAKYRCLKLQEVVQYIFMKIEHDTRLEPEKVKEITKAYFKEALVRLEEQCEASNNQSKAWKSIRKAVALNVKNTAELDVISANNIADRLDYLVPTNYDAPKNDSGERVGAKFSPFFFDGNSEAVLQYVIEENDLDVEEDTPTYRALQSGIKRAIAELNYQHKQRVDFEPDIQIKDDWFKGNTQQVVKLNSEEQTLLSVAYQKYLEGMKKLDKRETQKKNNTLNLWLEIIGDTPLGLIDKEKVRHFVSVLQKLPSNRKKRYKEKTVKEVLELDIPKDQLMNNKTINSYISPLSTFMAKYAIPKYDLGSKENPFVGMYLEKEGDEEDLRDPFSEKQLIGMFTTPVYKGCKGVKATQKYKKGKLVIKNSMYWTPLIALYSGARLNEILQLYTKDIYQVDKVWVFELIDDEDDKRIKTKTSKRIVPIHPKLIEMGFIEYLEKVKKKKEKRVFYDAEIADDGTYSNKFSKNFTYFLERFDLKTKTTSFHSFRHNVIDAFRFCEEVDEETSNAITGHKAEGTRSIYGSGKRTTENLKKHVPKLAKAMKHLQYPFLDDILK